MISFPEKLFVTGTDTGVGKTVICAMLMKGLGAAYWKPVQSGLEEITDTDWIRRHTGLPDHHFFPETYRLSKPLSPHAAAAADGIEIDLSRFVLPDPGAFRHLIVEGAGGVMVPLNDRHLMIDLMRHLCIPVLVVARSGLGTINHTLMTLDLLRRYEVEVWGVIMNGPVNHINRAAIEHFGQTRVIGEIEPLDPLGSPSLKDAFSRMTTPDQ